MKLIKLLFLMVFYAMMCFACQSDKNETAFTLKGTQWKLVGIVDSRTEVLKVLEPADCKECYTLTFKTDSTFSTYSTTNELQGDYKIDYKLHWIQVFNFGGTKRGEIGDGYLWWNIFLDEKSFSLENGQFKLYSTENKNYLLFKRLTQ